MFSSKEGIKKCLKQFLPSTICPHNPAEQLPKLVWTNALILYMVLKILT